MVKLDTGAGKGELPSLADFFGAAPVPAPAKKVEKASKKREIQPEQEQEPEPEQEDSTPRAQSKGSADGAGSKKKAKGAVTSKQDADKKLAKEEKLLERSKGAGKQGIPEIQSPERLAGKKRTKKEAEEEEEAAAKQAEIAEQDADKDERTIFVGGVPVSATRKDLKKFFKIVGPIESVRMRSMPVENPVLPKKASIAMGKLNTARETCNAYVVFDKAEDAVKALDMHGTTMDGHRLKVDKAAGGGSAYNSRLSVFIGNMPFNAEEEALRQHFAACGDISNVRLVRDSKSNLGKGFGYVTFADADQVMKAVALHGSKFSGRVLRVYRAARRPKDKAKPAPEPLTNAERRLSKKGRLGQDDKGKSIDKRGVPKFKKKAGLNELGQVKGGKKRMREKRLKLEAKKMRNKGGPGGFKGGKKLRKG
mmetsp:Transcript_45811/g.108668  ORF Transcript_45811/g.108668 Transcript_45811/m.108668 type:complete len:422 (-) Transcript_45811:94-1359(-)|eukprot:CAMPEP_0177711634 /NCGR_PEP_ID=MMETSP0484_2-20121128/11962_1 /TAXON_ID=354590 /ORGANISM="Rhodomonas lens, Strain RHODO" /LENGTH=421 /DNA_ID=CAMNT_0019223373 /DNA_START=113 /DNA_END=1378 /DNA_ORIENTATION=+